MDKVYPHAACRTTEILQEHPETGRYLSVTEVACKLKVCDSTIRREITRGKLQSVKIGGQIRISPEALEEYLRQQAPGKVPLRIKQGYRR